MDKLAEHNENLDTPIYLPSHRENFKEKHDFLEVPDLETNVQRHDNPHYWLQQDKLQIKQFQYSFFQNIILNEDRVPEIKIFLHFQIKLFRYNFQLLQEAQDQKAYINFPGVLTETEFLPSITVNRNKHVHSRDLTSFNIIYF